MIMEEMSACLGTSTVRLDRMTNVPRTCFVTWALPGHGKAIVSIVRQEKMINYGTSVNAVKGCANI